MYQFVEVKNPLIICLGSMKPVKRKKELLTKNVLCVKLKKLKNYL